MADSKAQAQRAARAVKVHYDVHTPIITIDQAIAANSYHQEPCVVRTGDLEAGLAAADHVIEGEVRVGGQEHFYLETTGTIAVPREAGEMELFATTQDIAFAQARL